jgi:hypothetical protein
MSYRHDLGFSRTSKPGTTCVTIDHPGGNIAASFESSTVRLSGGWRRVRARISLSILVQSDFEEIIDFELRCELTTMLKSTAGLIFTTE